MTLREARRLAAVLSVQIPLRLYSRGQRGRCPLVWGSVVSAMNEEFADFAWSVGRPGGEGPDVIRVFEESKCLSTR